MCAIKILFGFNIKSFLLFIKTICTKKMWWLYFFISFFVSIHKDTRNEFFKFILLLYLISDIKKISITSRMTMILRLQRLGITLLI